MVSDKRYVRDLVNICYEMGIRRVVISPGSRNAPLTISFSGHGGFQCYSIVDERSAAFFALGMSQQTRTPTVLVCTSGSAVLNYAPAIVEAYYQQLPLLVLTADRPPRLIDAGDGQTMHQEQVYRNYIRASFTIGDGEIESSREKMIKAIRRTKYPTPGPVHINIPLDEPLYGRSANLDAEIPIPVLQNREPEIPEKDIRVALKSLPACPRVLILIGMVAPSVAWREAMEDFARANEGFVILSETGSNVSHPRIISRIDRTLAGFMKDTPGDFVPDLLITIGHSIVSKKVKKWLRAFKLAAHWHVDAREHFPDTFHQLSLKIAYPPERFLSHLREYLHPDRDYAAQWDSVVRQTGRRHEIYMKDLPFVDLAVYPQLLKSFIPGTVLQMGNSTVVRYVQLFDNRRDLLYYSNRGVSGIDGCSSTAVGAAAATNAPVVLLTGDIAFGYDSNAFWHRHVSSHLKIIAFNNGGGSIFRFIEGPDRTAELENFFVTEQKDTIRQIAYRYEMPYYLVEDFQHLEGLLPRFLSEETEQPSILEIRTDGVKGARVLRAYFEALEGGGS